MQWIWSYPLWTFVLVAVLATILTYFLYRKSREKFEITQGWIILMSVLRWVSLFSIGLLLLNPLLRYVSNEKVDPVILILEDHSASISAGMESEALKDYQEQFQEVKNQLSDQFKIQKYFFGTDILDSIPSENDFSETGTDIHQSIQSLAKRTVGQHIGAVILSSDGIYNHGTNPMYHASFAGIPFYTIALGDTTTKSDVWIQRLRYSDVVYLGDEMQLLIDVAAENYRQQPIQVQLKNAAGNVLQTRTLNIDQLEWNATIEMMIPCTQAGIQRYTVSVSPLSGEKSFANNQQEFYVQVIDGRQKISILYDAPHPDIKFIKEVLSEMKNLEVSVSSLEEYKVSKNDIDVLILHGLPSLKGRNQLNFLQEKISSIPSVWWIVTTQTDLTALNQMQNVVQFQQVQRTPNDVTPVFQTSFQKFYVSDAALEWLGKVPPLTVPYGQYILSSQAEVCWNQKIGTVSTSQPLLVTSEVQQKKYSLLLGEGIWRWPMQEYYHFEEKVRSKEWIERLVQYISHPSDHRPFRIRTNKSIYNESEWISIEASVYNANAQMVNTSEVKVVLTSEKGDRQEIFMDKTQNAYTYNLGKLPAGRYSIQGTTELGNKKLQGEYQFAVKEFDIETHRTKADFNTLNTLALQSQGKMLHYSEVSQLKDLIENDPKIKPVFKEIAHSKSLINIQTILFILLVTLGLEWFLRRYFGQY